MALSAKFQNLNFVFSRIDNLQNLKNCIYVEHQVLRINSVGPSLE